MSISQSTRYSALREHSNLHVVSLWDAYKCHHTATVKNMVERQTNTDLMVIPGGITNLVQPAEIHVKLEQAI